MLSGHAEAKESTKESDGEEAYIQTYRNMVTKFEPKIKALTINKPTDKDDIDDWKSTLEMCLENIKYPDGILNYPPNTQVRSDIEHWKILLIKINEYENQIAQQYSLQPSVKSLFTKPASTCQDHKPTHESPKPK